MWGFSFLHSSALWSLRLLYRREWKGPGQHGDLVMGSHLIRGQSGFEPGLSFISVFWKDNGHTTAIATITFAEPDGYHTARSALGTVSVPSFLQFTSLELSLDFVLGSSGWEVSQGPKTEDCPHWWVPAPASCRRQCLLEPRVSPPPLYSSLQDWFQPGLCRLMWRLGTALLFPDCQVLFYETNFRME